MIRDAGTSLTLRHLRLDFLLLLETAITKLLILLD
jgi:hypothetical protein